MSANLKEEKGFKGKKNIYVCEQCFGHIVTVDVDDGTSPFLTMCKVTDGCRGMMESSFYRVYDQRIRPTHEWFRPDNLDGLSEAIKAHVSRGGLLLREAKS